MASLGAVVAPFGGENRTFDLLSLGAWRQLQKATGVGFWVLLDKLRTQKCGVDDYREVVRIGLLFGSVKDEATVNELMESFFDTAPLVSHLPLAIEIMVGAAFGSEDLKKAYAESPDATPNLPTDSGG